MYRYKRIVAIIILAYMFFTMAGCKAREAFSGQAPTVTPSIGSFIRQIDSGPTPGGTISLPVTPVDTLNPYQIKDRYVYYMTCLVFESLFVRTGESQVKPWLVESWETQDQTVWTFQLKEGITFHHGSSLSAYDVRYSLELLKKSENPFYNTDICENIFLVNVINSSQFEISLKTPDPSFIQKLIFPILSRSSESNESMIRSGTGPFLFDTMDDTQIKLKRYEDWWTGTPALLEAVVFKVYPETSMLDAFQDHEVDVAFVRNVDFTKYQHRTDLNYQVFPDNQGNYIYVNPNGLFGQDRRHDALFRYISYRLQDMNLGQVEYFDEYSEMPLDIEGFRQALIESGLFWNETQKTFTSASVPLRAVSIIVPKQDMQKLHMANFLVNILQDAGIKAQIYQTQNAQEVKRAIRNGGYDLSPVTGEIKPWEELQDALRRLQTELGYGMDNSYIMPIYRNQQAILYRSNIRGEKDAFYWNPYQGIEFWYLPRLVESSLEDS